MKRLLPFVLLLAFGAFALTAKADTVYQERLPSLTGVYPAGSTSVGAQAAWSIPTQDGTVVLQSIALHYDLAVNDFPTGLDGQGNSIPTAVISGGSLLFQSAQFPGTFLGGEWGIPIEPGQFSYDAQAGSFRTILQALPNNNFDIWVIQDLQQAYQGTPFTPVSNGTGTAALGFNAEFGLPQVADGEARVTYAAALFSPDSLITPSSPVLLVPEPSTLLLLIPGLMALAALRLKKATA
jgi:hypothetical protein